MGIRLNTKYPMLLFKMLLLMQLYSYLELEVEATQHRRNSTCNQPCHHNGTYTKKTFDENPARPKRPARMIPAGLLVRQQKDGTENEIIEDKRFYGPAYSCAEISELGYTLNGYYLVKVKNQSRINQLEVLGCRFKHIDGSKGAKEERVGFINIEMNTTKSVQRRSSDEFIERRLEETNQVFDQSKRPARLLPLRMFLGRAKNNTEITRFYGPATSCNELERLGYTLNGLYFVDCKDKSNKGKVEVIECRFKQPHGSKQVAKEERLGFVSIEAKKPKAVQRRSLNPFIIAIKTQSASEILKRPARLLPLQLLYVRKRNDTEETIVIDKFYGPPTTCSELGKLGYTLNGYYLVHGAISIKHMEIVLCMFHQPIEANKTLKEERYGLATTTTTKKPALASIPHNSKSGQPLGAIDQTQFIGNIGSKYKAIPLNHEARNLYMLMNNHGRCLKPDFRYPETITQTVCESKKDLIWGKTKPLGFSFNTQKTFSVCDGHGFCISFKRANSDIYLAQAKGQKEQNWSIVGGGNQLAQGDNCLAIQGDSDAIGSKAVIAPCDPQQKGQIWSFVTEK